MSFWLQLTIHAIGHINWQPDFKMWRKYFIKVLKGLENARLLKWYTREFGSLVVLERANNGTALRLAYISPALEGWHLIFVKKNDYKGQKHSATHIKLHSKCKHRRSTLHLRQIWKCGGFNGTASISIHTCQEYHLWSSRGCMQSYSRCRPPSKYNLF